MSVISTDKATPLPTLSEAFALVITGLQQPGKIASKELLDSDDSAGFALLVMSIMAGGGPFYGAAFGIMGAVGGISPTIKLAAAVTTGRVKTYLNNLRENHDKKEEILKISATTLGLAGAVAGASFSIANGGLLQPTATLAGAGFFAAPLLAGAAAGAVTTAACWAGFGAVVAAGGLYAATKLVAAPAHAYYALTKLGKPEAPKFNEMIEEKARTGGEKLRNFYTNHNALS